MKSQAYPVLILSLCLFLTGCGGGKTSAPAGAKKPIVSEKAQSAFDLFPIAEGNDWTYEMITTSVSREAGSQTSVSNITFKCVRVTETGNQKDAEILATSQEGKPVEQIIFRITPSGIQLLGYIVNGAKRLYSQPMPLLSFPAKPGQTIQWSAKGPTFNDGKDGDITGTITIKGEVEADTAVERVKAYRVDIALRQSSEGKTAHIQSVYYFAPKRGLARYLDSRILPTGRQIDTTLLLKSHTIR